MNCKYCNNPLTGNQEKYCSPYCATRYWRENNREKINALNRKYKAKNKKPRTFTHCQSKKCSNELTGIQTKYCCHLCACYQWKIEHPEQAEAFTSSWRKRNKELYNKVLKKSKLKYTRANRVKMNARRRARLNQVKKDRCRLCQSNHKLEFHHTDYKNGLGLTLCRTCHSNLHKEKISLLKNILLETDRKNKYQ